MRDHCSLGAQIRKPRFQDFPSDVAGDLACIAVAFADEQIGAGGDWQQCIGPFGVAGIGKDLLIVREP